MNSDKQDFPAENPPLRVSPQTIELLRIYSNCVQTLFAILKEEHALGVNQILRALIPFLGIALRREICGAFVGSMMAFGPMYCRGSLKDSSAYTRSLSLNHKFCARFKDYYGSPAYCNNLQKSWGKVMKLPIRWRHYTMLHLAVRNHVLK